MPHQTVTDNRLPTKLLESWDITSMWLSENRDDIQEWWEFCGPQLATLAHEAGYSTVTQIELLLFIRSMILPQIGRFPHASRSPASVQSRSILTYDARRLSTVGNGTALRTTILRFVSASSQRVIVYLPMLAKRRTDVDLEWYYHFRDRLHITDWMDGPTHESERPWQGRTPRMPVAFEFTPKGIIAKVYFTPPATPNNTSSFNTFADVVRPICGNDTVALAECLTFLSSDPVGATLRPDVLAIDCVSPLKSRIKLYAGTPITTFTSAISVMTLGGRIPVPRSSIDDLWALFRVVLGLDDKFCQDEELPVQNPFQPSRAHPEDYYSGLLYYFNLAPGSQLPDVKLYLPVIRYGRSDADNALGLQQFMISRQRGQYVDGFQRAMEAIAQRHNIGNGYRIQTHITITMEVWTEEKEQSVVRNTLTGKLYFESQVIWGPHGCHDSAERLANALRAVDSRFALILEKGNDHGYAGQVRSISVKDQDGNVILDKLSTDGNMDSLAEVVMETIRQHGAP
ncbi:putative prenyltransferase [Aspergillus nomiae NRRL 13137]|uniref:Putative prenyltransferase n=1 Tax=Aspergillus nomiae NRRL (strain ATCC 15546 / NRRL 13137 / CBS 260.88 / M93) TaxID=1509407 RepID=A0A0L1J3Y6_ASPN3|nr:putative prenyltransferase [Aspergillus nomiae NRRL 13137]KNG86153.1 putative prenyltransferase [Aspergillus nomiae NRRL 13137]